MFKKRFASIGVNNVLRIKFPDLGNLNIFHLAYLGVVHQTLKIPAKFFLNHLKLYLNSGFDRKNGMK